MFLAILMVVSVLPAPTNAVDVGTADSSGSVVGKFAKVTTFSWGEARLDPNYAGNMVTSDHYPELLVITGVAVVGSTTYYQLSAAEGYTWPAISNAADGWYLESTKVVVLEACGICGKPGCAVIHFYCDRCLQYDCGMDHLYCPACGEPDCTESHTWCGLCGDYDCGIVHEDMTPNSAPIIPDNPTMTEGAEVSIVDEYGDPVTEEGFLLLEGVKSSLSAWSDLDENVFYQWQIRYDSENDLWADIQGQRGKGILLSPAMVLSIIEDQGSAAVRCTVTAGDETLTSAAIPVEVLAPLTMAAFSLGSGSGDGDISAAAEDDENKVNLIINYVFTDGKIAANPWAATLPKGVAYSTTTPITVPVIAGYAPSLGDGVDTTKVTLSADGKLSLNFTAEDLAADQTISVVYQPAPVKVVVNHHWQNVADDNYTLHETVETTAVTGTKLVDVHKSYEGFYNLLYEHPTVAADGSTIVDVYYDRYYYLMKFELDGGYGIEPIYARYGAPIEIGTPTQAGYGFEGWVDENGNAVTVPATMPENGGTYYADWNPLDTKYATAYWVLNDDGTKTYIGSEILTAQSGSTVSGGNTLTTATNVCAMLAHTHNSSCERVCTEEDHVHGDGSCVYSCGKEFHDHTSGCDCTESICTTHTRDCYNFTSGATIATSATTSNYGQYYASYNGFEIYRGGNTNNRRYYVKINASYYQITGYGSQLNANDLTYALTCHTAHDSTCCSLEHDHSDCACTLHSHIETCYSCGSVAHTHTDACKSDLAKYLDYVRAEQDVTVQGDGSTVVNVYYEYRIYTIRFIYAKKNGSSYQIAGLTRDGTLNNCWWTSGGTALPTFKDPSGKTERSTVVINGTTYYYISLTAKFGADISAIWPSANIGDAGSYEWGSWAAAAGTGYREKYGDAHANIVGPYPTMSTDMIVDNPELLEDGTYLAQNMIAWWGSNQGIQPHAYHNYYEMLPGEEEISGKTYTTYNGKRYRLEETYVFTAAHNGDTRVDPIYYNGFACINDSRDTSNDTQENSNNYANNGNCDLCGNTCNYCNTFYYDRNSHSLYFWNYNGYLQEGTGAQVVYGDTLTKYGAYVNDAFMRQPENYPDNLEADAYQFAGWYTTSDCLDGTEMDWTSTMPDSDMTVYAKWVPVPRTVRFFLDRADMDARVTIPERMDELWKETHDGQSNPNSPYMKFDTKTDIPNKSFLSEIDAPGMSEGYENHPYKGFTFVGWFYMEDGVEKAFDPKNMPVTQDMDLYGKWSSNVLCPYEIRFVLDENGNGVLDAGETTFVADPITGSTLAGNSRTFDAKGDTALYADYQAGYYPNVASHTIDFKASDEAGVVYNFLYKQGDPEPYTVKYLEKGTNKVLATEVTYPNNQKAVVTENFKPIPGYMPDAFQKTLVVVPDSDENVITFYYTVDTVRAPYQVNHYVQTLDGTGWIEYRSADFTGDIDKAYSADALTITGFTFSAEKTADFNITQKINAYDKSSLPGEVRFDGVGTVSGTLTGNGMQLNLYYTRNTHSYKVQYLEYGTNEVLEEEKAVTNVYHGTLVTENAITIRRDMDGDGQFVDFQLYEATAPSQSATITDDSKVFVFYYVRCTGEELSVTKTLTGNPGEDISFDFNLTSTATDFAEISNGVYAYEIKEGETSVEKGYKSVTNGSTIPFSLKAGQTITFFNLPTAVYTVTEQSLPLGYYCAESSKTVTLTKDAKVNLTVTNEYAPASLAITKTVDRIENVNDNVTDFIFYITVPAGITGTYDYAVGNETYSATVTDGKLTIVLEDGETALFANLPVGEYIVAEHDYTSEGYSATYVDSDGNTTDGKVTLVKGRQQTVTCTNAYPVGSLTITKTVKKDYTNDEWTGGTFKFTVVRTDGTLNSTSYPVYSGTTKIGDAIVGADGKLVVEIAFTELGTKTIKIDNLPQGKYTVEEAENVDYTQDKRSIETSISPTDYAGKAEFTNTYKKHLGDLTITKNVTALTGYTAPEDAEFAFIVSGTALRKSSYKVVIDGASADCEVVNGALRLRLKGGQTAVIKDLAPADYQVEETVANEFVLTASSGTAGTINAEDTAKAEFTNTYVPRGSLKVTKFVEKEFEADEIPAGQQTFTFTVTIPEDVDTSRTSYAYQKYHVGSSLNDPSDDVEVGETGTLPVTHNNQLTFTLENGQYIVVEDLPVGTVVIAEEKNTGFANPQFGETLEAVWAGGAGSFNGTITKDETTAVVCVNTYQRTTGTLKITKIVNNLGTGTVPVQDFVFNVEMIPPVSSFTVTVKYTDQTGNRVKTDETITVSDCKFDLVLQDGWTATIENLPASQVTVTEATYDNIEPNWGTVGNTGLIRGGQTLVLTCTNTYPVNTGNLKISKTVTKEYDRDTIPADDYTIRVDFTTGENKTPISGTFTYKVFDKDSDSPIRTDSITTGGTLTLKADQYAMIYDIPACDFDVMEIHAASGLDKYKVSYVHNEGHKILVGQTVTSNITNTYKRQKGNITIIKKLTDIGEDDGQEFLFHIIDSNGKTVTSVTLKAGEAKTIYDLPVGTYTVQEDTSWSWRYTLTTDNNVKADLATNTAVTVEFVNDRTENRWLNFFTNWLNVFQKS